MDAVGIIAEYNPFHNGHLHHIEETRRMLGSGAAVVAVMSGDFVQRGEAAVYSKFARAEAAARCGADVVFELPLPWSLSSAEGFARGAVGLLSSLGCVKTLSFGSECGEIKPLETLAFVLLDPKTGEDIKAAQEDGTSYAAARTMALSKYVGELSTILDTPNNILAVEYIKALYSLHVDMDVITVPRYGSRHDGEGAGRMRSAAELRSLMGAEKDTDEFIPAEALEVFDRERKLGRGPILMSSLEPMLMSRLRMFDDAYFSSLPDATEGLDNRLCGAVREESSWDGILAAAKSKRYALSRIRRMCICACLGVRAGMSGGIPPYARLLAATETGRELLREISGKTQVPVITKPAKIKEMSIDAFSCFSMGARAHDLYVLAAAAREERRGGGDWRRGPAMV